MENQGNSNQEKVNQQFSQQFGQTTPPQYGQPRGPVELPNSTTVLVLGIISIVSCICYGIVGIILGIISIVLSGKANTMYELNPALYRESSYKNMKAGRICAIIGLCLSAVFFVFIIIYICIVGFAFSMVAPWGHHFH